MSKSVPWQAVLIGNTPLCSILVSLKGLEKLLGARCRVILTLKERGRRWREDTITGCVIMGIGVFFCLLLVDDPM